MSAIDEDLSDGSTQHSYHSDEEPDNGHFQPPVNDLTSFKNTKTKHTGIMSSYVRDWINQDAFREVYQNWKDSIRTRFGIKLQDFNPITEETETKKKGQILTRALHPDSGELMGFILFQMKLETRAGAIWLVNFGANLQLWHLAMGGSDKQGNLDLAGGHGEGLKASILQFSRYPQNYSCHMESSGANWRWFFNDKNELDCQIVKVDPAKIKKMKDDAKGKPRTTKSRVWEDVAIIIGRKDKNVPVEEYRNMMKVTIDLDRPKIAFRTSRGELILDSSHQNKLYLKGLLLRTDAIYGKGLTYAFNLYKGDTDRDRKVIAHEKVADAITAIYDELLGSPSPDPAVVNSYTDLLLTKFNRTAEVIPIMGKLKLGRKASQCIWKRMLELNNDNGRVPFYFVASRGNDDAHLIRTYLHRKPVEIDKILWNLLRIHVKNFRTAVEEQQHRFENTELVPLQDTQFARNVDWLLKCLLQSHPATKSLKYYFVKGKDIGLDMVMSKQTWIIDEKWQNFNTAHEHGDHHGCENTEPSEKEPFTCDHIAQWLWDTMISQEVAVNPHGQIAKNKNALKILSCFKLVQIPRCIRGVQTDRRGELAVHWESVDSYQGLKKLMSIRLHQSDCFAAPSEQCITLSNTRNSTDVTCACPHKEAIVSAGVAVFEHLDPNMTYHPQVSRAEDGALCGLPTVMAQPRSEDIAQEPFARHDVSSNSAVGGLLDAINAVQDSIPDNARGQQHLSRPAFNTEQEASAQGADPDGASRDDASFCEECQGDCRCLYADPTHAGGPSSVTLTATPTRRGTQHSLSESYVLGDCIDHADLGWADGFPGSHDFFGARNHQHNDVLIAKRKLEHGGQKRALSPGGNPDEDASKRGRQA